MPKEFKKRLLSNFILSILLLIFFIIFVEGNFVDKKTLSEKNYSTKINLYILRDGSVHVEQNIKVNSKNYSTHFLYDSNKLAKFDYNENIENLKVYFNDTRLTYTKNSKGYFNYKYTTNYSTRICYPQAAESGSSIDPFNSIEIFLPESSGNLKIVYDLKNHIITYNDINYLKCDFEYNHNIFDDDVQINIIMPEFADEFLVNTNFEFNHSSIIKSLNDTTKQIYLSGLKNDTLNIEVLFDRNICESGSSINQDNYDYLSNKSKESKKERFELYLVMFMILSLTSIVITSSRMIRISRKFR